MQSNVVVSGPPAGFSHRPGRRREWREPMADKPIAVVTGVGPGTGSAIVRRFAGGGFRVIALARSPDRIRALEQELPDTHAVICDISSQTQVADAVADVRKSYGPANVLIHNAVGGGWGTFLEI